MKVVAPVFPLEQTLKNNHRRWSCPYVASQWTKFHREFNCFGMTTDGGVSTQSSRSWFKSSLESIMVRRNMLIAPGKLNLEWRLNVDKNKRSTIWNLRNFKVKIITRINKKENTEKWQKKNQKLRLELEVCAKVSVDNDTSGSPWINLM